ncbi:MAG TPA: threonine/serine dehydratase [Candidatus Bathyarchaeia archaeon]|nr:threonine/serine dehydratase [Candidatus Bathyarchaeia archaeon]
MTVEVLPSLDGIKAAAKRISGVATRTPLVESPALSKKLGRQIYLKLECFQPIRVFKIRGAYNKISQLSAKKIVAISSGNHGLAVAYSSRLLGKKCTVVVPETIVQEKYDAIIENGAEVVKFGKYHADREAKAREIVSKTDATLVHPFNDLDIIEGQGTCGLEICEQLEEVHSVIVPVGGGGLISGISIAVKGLRPFAKVFGVEPSGAAKMQAALKAGMPVLVEPPRSIADGLMPSIVGHLTLEACQKYVDGVFSVSDEEILQAMSILIRSAHIFPEPSGAAGLALLLSERKVEKLGDKVVLVISGGNVSLELLKRTLNQIT